ncbi:MAG: O-antigen ligase family protein [Terrimicrobiaceae bacterium]|nr:O-antigen ligase family protein [Terrimicrobiaceae bacterium]
MTPEFFYGDVMRWNFGFENPNKAAVVFACVVPLFWAGWLAALRLHPLRRRILVASVSAVGFLACWTCLLLTFSRGGAVGAVAGMVLASFWQRRPAWSGFEVWWSAILIGLVLATALTLGAVERGTDALGEDASVGNRIELWSAALQMAVENPAGFGPGNSGREFMQWYQPIDRTEGYRTMVNSYLTFLVERGWVAFAFAVAILFAFWCWTWPRRAQEPRTGLRVALWGSLAAFLVSGVFSTTMEEPWLWILPGAAMLLLLIVRVRMERQPVGDSWMTKLAAGLFLLVMASLFVGGLSQSRSDSLKRSFGKSLQGGYTVKAVEPKDGGGGEVGLMVDEAVLGPDWGKLVRSLAVGARQRVTLMESVDRPPKTVVLTGESATHFPALIHFSQLILVAPAVVDEPFRGTVLLPEIDEDGRVRFWMDRQNDETRVVLLAGVGNRIEWEWDRVVSEVAGR